MKDELIVDEDIHQGTEDPEEKPMISEPRKIPKHFQIKYPDVYKSIEVEEKILSSKKETIYLKLMFFGMLMLIYGVW